jgi:hypothetical protein
MVERMDGEMTNSETILTKEARSPNKPPGQLVGYWVIGKFFSHSDLGISHSIEMAFYRDIIELAPQPVRACQYAM